MYQSLKKIIKKKFKGYKSKRCSSNNMVKIEYYNYYKKCHFKFNCPQKKRNVILRRNMLIL